MTQDSRFRVLVSAPSMLADRERLEPLLAATGWDIVYARDLQQQLSSEQLIEQLQGIDGHLCGGDRFNAGVYEACPQLKALCKWGTGTDAIDLQAARSCGVPFRNVPDAFSVPVSDAVMCYMLCFARRQPMQDRLLKQGRWERLEAVSLGECSLGVVGLGNIGSTLLRKARAFGLKLYGTDPIRPHQQLIDETGVEILELDELLEKSDFVSINCDLNPTSRGMFGKDAFKKMKSSAVLINTARGPIVRQDDLEQALVDGEIAGAGLDVFESEPLGSESRLVSMDQVMLSPHVANSSPRACWAVHQRVIQNLTELFAISGAKPGAMRDREMTKIAGELG